jgi:3-hydroxyacyl-[acyl-carrier-protein] dehydratase
VSKTADDTTIPPIHRQPYRFIDRVVRYDRGAAITCTAAVRGDEPYFAGHFPGHPIVPGVFGIEMLFQAAELFLVHETGAGRDGTMRLGSVSSARFMSPITPPREVTVAVTVKEDRGTEKVFSGRLSDGPEVFVQALFTITV